jgi:hypothetical protein
MGRGWPEMAGGNPCPAFFEQMKNAKVLTFAFLLGIFD